MRYIVCAFPDGRDDKVEMCETENEARRIAEKWSRELNCEACIGMVIGSFMRLSEWRGATLDRKAEHE